MLEYTTAFRAIFVIAIITEVLGRGSLIPGTRQEKSAENELGKPRLDGRIVGGSVSSNGANPYQVSVQYGGLLAHSHVCGGSIISNQWILTAGDCVHGLKAFKIKARLGSSEADKGGELIGVRLIVQHEKFNKTSLDYNIALLQTIKRMKFSATKQPVKLPNANDEFPAGEMCTVTGFGKTKYSTKSTKKLHQVDVPIVDRANCTASYQQIVDVTKEMMCAGYPEGGKGPCQGDSGSPLVCNGHLAGIFSWSNGCAIPNYPGVYLSVSSFRKWIHEKSGV